ncbi:MAG: hypothetical protein IIZ64_02675 [Erysipelotrichaceae bacterium]|nr:hypothetical protein [Erysipelotrichaceae bacterium]MBQ1533704.1 hypothetical protein [Erysipelotrichaceae bacterium]
MRCIYCDREIKKITFTSLFLERDPLCIECRRMLKVKRKNILLGELKTEVFYEYDGIFKSMLLQYKECCDEALKDVFLYSLKDYIGIRYFGYHILFVPSSQKKRQMRGFDHLELIFEDVKLPRARGLRMKEDLIQEGKNARERSRMRDNYIYEGEKLNKALIVDDVITTGSSIVGVYEAIKDKAGHVRALSLANK